MSFFESTELGFQDRRKTNTLAPGELNPQIKTGLRNRFILAVSIFVIAMSASLFAFYQYLSDLTVVNEAKRVYTQIAKELGSSAQHFISLNQTDKIADAWKHLQYMESILYAECRGTSGQLLYQHVKPNCQDKILPWPAEQQSKDTRFQKGSLSNGQVVYEYIERIPLGKESVAETASPGYIRLGIAWKKQKNIYYQHLMNIILFLILSILGGGVLAWYLSTLIINPIQQLARAMKFVASEVDEFDEAGMPVGRRFRRINDVDLNIGSQDEIGQLANEFQIMMQKLEHSYQILEASIEDKNRIVQEKSQLADNLREANRKNEMIIKDRTREVVEKNLRLYEIFEELQFQKEELISMNEQLEKISRMKSEFLASMSHELRTPMNSIIGFAEVLKDKMFGDLNERQEKYLGNILASARHLLQLINNILDISKVEAGKMKLVVEPYSLNRVIDEVQNTIKTLAYKKNINMELKLSRDMVMQGDISKMKQILYNLLSNAIKFTDEKGSVTVFTEEIPIGKYFAGGPGSEAFMVETPAALMTVSDTGIGIKEEDQTRIFIEFEQTDQTRKRKYEGTGLGLALTRKLVVLHGGHIWIESVIEKGTQVYILLPIKVSSDENENAEDRD